MNTIFGLKTFQRATVNLSKTRFAPQLVQSSRFSSNRRQVSMGYNFPWKSALLIASGIAAGAAYSTSSPSYCEGKETAATDRFANTALYPPIKPYFKGSLKVSDIHTIAYSQYGNPNGKAVLFVHGGPGGGTDPGNQIFH